MTTPGLGSLANIWQESEFRVPGTAPFKPLTYVACPYTHPDPTVMEGRYRNVTEAAAWMITRNGWNVFSPITHSHPLATMGNVQGDWAFWKKFDTDYLKCSERFVILEVPGWRESKGVTEETKIAIELRIPIRYIHWDIASGGWLINSVPELTGAPPPYDKAELDAKGIGYAKDSGSVRQFSTGATRDTEDGKPDYEGFLCPQMLEAFGAYMHKHRKQSDGKLRDSDNWQKGIPRNAYIKSIWRHLVQLWKLHRGLETRDEKGNPVTIEDACCALLFNVQGYLFEHLLKR